jgi:PAS domain S-box-containing protein
LLKKDGTKIPGEITSRIFYDEKGEAYTSMIFRDISDRKKAEQKLKESEVSLKEAQHLAKIGSSIYDFETGEITWSDELYEMLGRDKNLGPTKIEDNKELFTPESLTIRNEALKRSMDSGESASYECEINRFDNKKRIWVNSRIKAEKNESGKIKRILGTTQDITEQKRVSEMVKAERQRLFDVLETLPSYVALLDPDYHVPFANKYFRENFGESNGKRCFEYLFGRTEPCEICETYNVLKTMKPHSWEWTGPNAKTYDVYDFPFKDTDGSTLIMEMGIDITERKKAEEEYRKLNSELEQRVKRRTSEIEKINKDLQASRLAALNLMEDAVKSQKQIKNLYEELVHSSELRLLALRAGQLGTFDFNFQTGEIIFDEQAKKIYDYSGDEYLDITNVTEWIHSDDRERVNKEIKGAFEREANGEFESEYRIVRKDDTIYWIYAKGQVHYVGEGQNRHGDRMIGVLQDITTRKNMEEELKRSRENLEFKVQERTAELKKITNELYRINRALRTITACNQAQIHSTTENELLKEICRVIVEEGGYRLAWVGYAENDEKKSVLPIGSAGYEEGYLEKAHISWADNEYGHGPTGTAIRTGKISICRNMLTDPDFEPWRKEAIKRGYASSIVLPLTISGVAFGAISIYAVEPEAFDVEEVKLLSELAEDLSYSVKAIRNDIERKSAEEKLTVLNDEILDLYNNAPCGYHSLDKYGIITRINNTELKWLGYERDEVINKMHITKILAPSGLGNFNKNFPLLIKNGFIENVELEFLRKDGSSFFLNLNSTAVYDENGEFKNTRTTLFDITERRMIEQKLQLALTNWTETFNAIGDRICLLDKDGIIVQCNKSMTDMLSVSEDKIMGRKCHSILHGTNCFIENCPFAAMRKSKKRESHELKIENKYYTVSADPIFDKNGNIQGAVHILSDITQRKEAEEKVRAASLYTRTLIESSLDPLLTIDKYGKINDVNNSTENITGIRRDSLIGTDFSDYFTEPDKAKTGYKKVLSDGLVRDYPLTIRHKSGKTTDVLYNATVYKNEFGNTVGIFAAARDITKIKEAEKKIKESEAELIEAQHIGHIGSWSWNKNTNVITLSNEIYRIYNLNTDKPVPTLNELFNFYKPEYSELIKKTILKSIDTGESFELDLELPGRDVPVKWVTVRGNVITIESGKFIGLRGTMQDVTERKKAEEQLRELAHNLQSIREEERTRLSRELHDNFGQSLTGLKMSISSLEKRLSRQDDTKSFSDIFEKIKGMKSIIDELAMLTSRLSMELRPNVLDMLGLKPAIEWLAEDFKRKSGIDCNVSSALETIDIIPSHATEIFRIIQEIFTNVIRHSEANLVNVNIFEKNNSYTIEIKDNGKGIKEADISSPYSFGLMGMHERALLFNGKIDIIGASGSGTRILINIPKNKK